MSATIAREVAEAEFQRWVSAMALTRRLAPEKLDEKDGEALRTQRAVLVDAIEDGNLVVNENGEFVFTPTVGDTSPLTFFEPDYAALSAMDKAKQGEGIERTKKLLGAFTKTSSARFANMKVRDGNVCNAILMLFLG